MQLLLSLQSFPLDYALTSDPIALGFPARNLLSDSSYHRLVAGHLSKINIPTFFHYLLNQSLSLSITCAFLLKKMKSLPL